LSLSITFVVLNDIHSSAGKLKKVKHALEEKGYKQVVLAGGVAANSEIRRKFFEQILAFSDDRFGIAAGGASLPSRRLRLLLAGRWANIFLFDVQTVAQFPIPRRAESCGRNGASRAASNGHAAETLIALVCSNITSCG